MKPSRLQFTTSSPDIQESTLGAFLQQKYTAQFLNSITSSEESPRWQQPNPSQHFEHSSIISINSHSQNQPNQSISMHLTSQTNKHGTESSGRTATLAQTSMQDNNLIGDLETMIAKQQTTMSSDFYPVESVRTAKTIKAHQQPKINHINDKYIQLQDALSTAKITQIDQTLTCFVERLMMRQRLTDVADTLSDVQTTLLKMVSSESNGSKLHKALYQEQLKFESTLQSFGGPRTHIHALENVEGLAKVLQVALTDYVKVKQQRDPSPSQFVSVPLVKRTNQMLFVDEMDPDAQESAEKGDSFSGYRAVDASKHERSEYSVFNERLNTSLDAINPFAFVRSVESREQSRENKSVSTNGSNNSGAIRENLKQANLLQAQLNLEEIRLCNDMIDTLRAENAKLEKAAIEQRSEIQSLKNQVYELTKSPRPSLNLIEKRDIEAMVVQLRQDLEKTSLDRRERDMKILEQDQVIVGLQGQIRELTNRLATRDGVSQGEHQMLVAQKNKEVEEMRKENFMITKRCQDLSKMLKTKESEIFRLEERSKTLLQNAQKDAEACISYFKKLACEKTQATDNFNDPMQAPRQNSRSRERDQYMSFNPNTPQRFPQSLAPISNRPGLQSSTHTLQTTLQVSEKKPRNRSNQKGSQERETKLLSLSPKTSPKIINKTVGIHPFNRSKPIIIETLNSEDTIDFDTKQAGTTIKVDLVLNSLSRAFQEIYETKTGIFTIVSSFHDCFAEQMEKFSVLAYDYLDRIDLLAQRESELEERVKEEQEKVDQLKQITHGQAEHIKTQASLIGRLNQSIHDHNEAWDRIVTLKNTERNRLSKVFNDELPMIAHSLSVNTKNIDTIISLKIKNSNELKESSNVNSMLKSKVRILESELDKVLSQYKQLEETQATEKVKSDRLTDLIKDIWLAEVPGSATNKQQNQFGTMATLRSGQGMTGQTSRVSTLQNTAASHFLLPDVPMPISWLSDIADHIKQLKEMNDVQRDEVYQLYLTITKNGGRTHHENPSITASSKSESVIQHRMPIEPSSEEDQRYIISEDEAESNQNEESLIVREEDDGEDSERIYDRNLKMLQQTGEQLNTMHKKEMSFSRQSDENEISTESEGSKVGKKKSKARPMNSTVVLKRKQTRFAKNQQRSLSQERNKADNQRQCKTRNHSANALGKSREILRMVTGRNEMPNYFVTDRRNSSPAMAHQLKSNLKSNGASQGPLESTKRNELYAMLHDEVKSLLIQVKVGKETIIQMKQMRKKQDRKLHSLQCDIGTISEQKQECEVQLRSLENCLKVQTQQNEEYSLIIEDKDYAIDTLKTQIEDFEKELGDLQGQIAHVMKLNGEISASAEHWEKAYHEQVANDSEARAVQEQDYKSMHEQLTERIQQFKKKLREKDSHVKALNHQLNDVNAFLDHQNQIKMMAMSVATNTGPEMELLEQQNQVLKDQLTQVKDDIAAVLDQYESEQVNNKSLNDLLHSERATNGSLANELHRLKTENNQLVEHIQQLQGQCQQLERSLELDQAYYKEQMQHASEINEQLQQQVEAVTQLTEELQQQVSFTSRSNTELVQKTEQVENQRKVLEYRIKQYTAQIAESNEIIHELQQRLRTNKRESRSYSISRNKSCNNTLKAAEQTASSQLRLVSCSSSSVSPHHQRRGTSNKVGRDVLLATGSSIFDECSRAPESKKPLRKAPLSNSRKQDKPQNLQAKAVQKIEQSRRTREDRSVSPNQTTQQVSLATTANVSASCCCQGNRCRNNSKVVKEHVDKQQMTEESTSWAEESTFRELDQIRSKNEATQYAKKKVKKLMKMTEDLVRYYCMVAQERNDHRMLAQGRFLSSGPNSSMLESSMDENILQDQLNKWNNRQNEFTTQTDKKNKRDKAINEAKMYFDRKSPSLVACLNTLAENYNPNPQPMIFEAPIKQTKSKKADSKKEPPRIVNTAYTRGEVDLQAKNCSYIETETDLSDKLRSAKQANQLNFNSKRKSLGSSSAGRNTASLNPTSTGKNNQQRNSRSTSFELRDDQMISIGNNFKSPTSTARQVTATFRMAPQFQELQQHCRQQATKLMQLGRNLAGVCFGGCIFMLHQIPDSTKQQVDKALQFLAGDISEADSQSKTKLEETAKVIEALLALLSLKNETRPQSYNSIMDLSGEHQINSLCREMQSKTHQIDTISGSASLQNKSINMTGSMKEKLNDLEQRIKQKSVHVTQLEATLVNLLNPKTGRRLTEMQSVELICQDPATLKNVLVNLKRAISKLKIELHADYLTLGQLNIECQTARESRDGLQDHNNYATMGTMVPNHDNTDFSHVYHVNNQLQSIFGRGDSSQQTSQAVSGNQSVSSYKHNGTGHRHSQGSALSFPLMHSIEQTQILHRQNSVSSSTTTPQCHAIDRIVEELKGLTFEM